MRRSRVRSDDGFALVFTMGAVALITAVAIGGYVLAEQTLSESVRGQSLNQAYQLASTGLEQEISRFNPENLDDFPKTVTMNGGMYVASVNDVGGGVYELISEGRSAGVTETVLVRFTYMNLWDMNISGDGQSAMGVRNGFNGNSIVIGSMYVAGELNWDTGNGEMWGGPLFVAGEFNGSGGSASIGSAALPVPAYGPVENIPGKVWVENRGSSPELDIPELTPTMLDQYRELAEQYAADNPRALPLVGTQPANQNATHYTVFDGSTTFGSAPFGSAGDAIWFDGSVLHIAPEAVIYVEGDVTFSSAISGYQGSGTIVCEGDYNSDADLVPTPTTWETLYGETLPQMSEGNCLGLIGMGDLSTSSNADWTVAAVFINGNYHTSNNAHNNFRGSLIASNIDIQTTNTILSNQVGLGNNLPDAMRALGLEGFTARGDWVRR